MILHVYTVYDSAVQAYLQPFFCRSRGEALRSFGDACNDKSKPFFQHGLDYTLVYLGEFDDAGGTFSCAPPVRIISAHECVEPDDGGAGRAGSGLTQAWSGDRPGASTEPLRKADKGLRNRSDLDGGAVATNVIPGFDR